MILVYTMNCFFHFLSAMSIEFISDFPMSYELTAMSIEFISDFPMSYELTAMS
jgi:hypothetical protein